MLSFFCSVSELGSGEPGALFFLLGIWVSIFCLVSGQVSGPGALFFFCLVSEPGWSDPGALLFFCLVSEPGRSGPGAGFCFLLGILRQLRGVPTDGEKRVDCIRRWTFLLFFG